MDDTLRAVAVELDALDMLTLADLIQARRRERGWSYRVLAGRADDVFTAQRWQQLATGVRIREFPEPATLQAMADALEVDVAAVILAAAASIGMPVHRHQSALAAMLPSNTDDMTQEQRDAVLAVIRSIVAPAGSRLPHRAAAETPVTAAAGADSDTLSDLRLAQHRPSARTLSAQRTAGTVRAARSASVDSDDDINETPMTMPQKPEFGELSPERMKAFLAHREELAEQDRLEEEAEAGEKGDTTP